jgi:acetyl esterase
MELDPSLFQPEAIDPETRAFLVQVQDLFASQPPMHLQDPAEIREARRQGRGFAGPLVFSPSAKVRTIPGPGGPITLRCFVPAQVDAVYLYIHGGGWVLGSADAQDPRLEEIANNCNVAVVSVEYRLAPEDPYPAGPDDCEAAALWLAKNAKAEFGTGRLLIGGGSAGAHLAVVALLRLRDKHQLRPFAAADLLFGVYDVDGSPSVRNWGERVIVLSQPIMQWFGDHFVPGGLRRDPDVSPLYADLSGMPPALFSVGTMDPLLDDSLFMHQRWLAAGNPSELDVYPGGIHGFTGYPNSLGRRAREKEEAFLKKHAKP